VDRSRCLVLLAPWTFGMEPYGDPPVSALSTVDGEPRPAVSCDPFRGRDRLTVGVDSVSDSEPVGQVLGETSSCRRSTAVFFSHQDQYFASFWGAS
jgi:hypothetical protein